ncbi:MAG TPA: hypothetical protein DCZ94_08315 [Lentisphaeria bacterium]|nr:MAG: hypothetical protein A2X48_19795 [Lentisphaerae bacterium GWF2_49_21]HBC86941.1 hypothetical protein [Lentisphaeria bacterium]
MNKRKVSAVNPSKWFEDICFRGTDSPVVVMRAEHREDIGRHIHDFAELVLVLEGTGMHGFGNKSYKLQEGDCFIIEPGMHHSYNSCEGLKLVNILIRSSFVEKYWEMLKEDPAYAILLGRQADEKRSTLKRPSLSQEELDSCMRIVAEIERERKEMKRSHTVMMTGLLLELFVRIFRSVQRAGAVKDDLRSPWLSKVLDYLEIHFAEEIPISLLQKMAGMSERSFQRHFLEMTGLTPLRYILRLRIAHACRLLREGNKSVYEAASLCGIENCSYFCRLFKSITGHSPRKYAKLSNK